MVVALATLFGMAAGFLTASDEDTPVSYTATQTLSVVQPTVLATSPLVSFTPSQLAVYTTVGDVPVRAARELAYPGTPQELASRITTEPDDARRGAADQCHRRRRGPCRRDRQHLRPPTPDGHHRPGSRGPPGADRPQQRGPRRPPGPDQRARRPDRGRAVQRRCAHRAARRADQPVPHRLRRAAVAEGTHHRGRSGHHPGERRPPTIRSGSQRPQEPAGPHDPLRVAGATARRRAGPRPGPGRHPGPHQGGRREGHRPPGAGRDPLPAPAPPAGAHHRDPTRLPLRRGLSQPALRPGLRPQPVARPDRRGHRRPRRRPR